MTDEERRKEIEDLLQLLHESSRRQLRRELRPAVLPLALCLATLLLVITMR